MLISLLLLFFQIPSNTPNPGSDSSIELNSTFDWLMFVILPIVIVILYFIWKKGKKN